MPTQAVLATSMQFASTASSMTRQFASHYMSSSFTSCVTHPVISLKLVLPTASRRYSQVCYATNNNIYKFPQHKKQISRLYARRCIDIAAASFLTRQYITNLENSAGIVSKPSIWSEGVEAFEERRKKFGESVGQLGKTKLSRLWAAGSRLINLALLASPLVVLVPSTYLFPDSKTLSDSLWSYALWSVEKAGPTYIKCVQWASTRSDLFSAEFCANFSKLQDRTLGHSWEETDKMLQEKFGVDYDSNLFEFTSKEPIGSGCIAQVYQAKLRQPVGTFPAGSTVAIKIQHPNILHKVCVDFYIFNKVAKFLESVPKLNLDYLSIKDSVDQFRGIMLPQLDLRCEARNLMRFRKNFEDDSDIAFPKPFLDLTDEKILVESFIHGEPILKYLGPDHTTEERQHLATIGLESTMKMIFLHDFVHGDLHPGNIIINRNEKNQLRMNMIDCGLVVEMGEKEHQNLVLILGALVKRDGAAAGQLMVDTSRRCLSTPLDVELFVKGIQQIVKDDEDNNFLEKVGDYLAEICYLACKHKVKLEASFINASLACEIMEGIASALYPDMLVQHIALPMVVKAEAMHGIQKRLFGWRK